MSYLNNLRLVFSGKFQSDVSTVNNDVTHFDNAKFKPEFQEYGMPGGWWNPCGSGAFRLIDCKVTELGYSDGTTASSPSADPVIGMYIGGSNSTVSGKMVDLDPQMQLVSQIWGLNMRLTDGKTSGFFDGQFQPAAFRDILFGRQQQSGGGDQTATAIYQSVLTDVSWLDPDNSPFLQQLKALYDKVGKLSVRMMVYSYNMDHNDPEFTLGRVSGVIGPALEDEPDSFVLGRRFAPANGQSTAQNINFFNAQLNVDPTGQQADLCVDLSNALPLLNGEGDFVNLGQLQLVALGGEFNEGTTQLSSSLFTPVGEPIPYLNSKWMEKTGALFNVTGITGSTLQTVMSEPLALMRLENNEILIRETQNGMLLRADNFVQRLNPGDSQDVNLYASQYGVPLANADLTISVQPPGASQGQPTINVPASSIVAEPKIVTNQKGAAVYHYQATDPNNPRGYIDGQVYLLSYKFDADPGYIQHMFDFIANLVFDDYQVPDNPSWQDIEPFMTQYSNLYPVMSRMLVDLGDYDSFIQHRSILELAFTRPINDPNYMPVTRDLSAGKREAVIKFLTQKDANGEYVLPKGNSSLHRQDNIEPCPSCEVDTAQPMVSVPVKEAQEKPLEGSKKIAARQYKQQFKR